MGKTHLKDVTSVVPVKLTVLCIGQHGGAVARTITPCIVGLKDGGI